MEKIHVLVIEDNHDLAAMNCLFLKKAGINTVVAHTGQQALLEIARLTPDVILMDLSLPDMNASALLSGLRQQKGCAEIPVILASGSDMIEEKAVELSCQGYLKKPFEATDLIKKIKSSAEKGCKP